MGVYYLNVLILFFILKCSHNIFSVQFAVKDFDEYTDIRINFVNGLCAEAHSNFPGRIKFRQE